jgi:Ca2+-binding RTX toxin-like protein
MDEQLKLGIPDDEAAIAPVRRFTLSAPKSKLLSRFIVPLALGAWAFMANKLVSAELEKAEFRHTPRPPMPDEKASVHKEAVAPIPEQADLVVQPDDGKVVQLDNFRAPPKSDSFGSESVFFIANRKNDSFQYVKDETHGGVHAVAVAVDAKHSESAATSGNSSTRHDASTTVSGGLEASGRSQNAPREAIEKSENHRPTVVSMVNLGKARKNETLLITVAALLAGAVDADGDVLHITQLAVNVGELSVRSDGNWLFTPEKDYQGPIEFTYTIDDGQDSVHQKALATYIPAPVIETEGTANDDILVGTAGNDVIDAKAGDDIVYAREGDDVISGGDGNDRLIGGDGHDVIYGGGGDDIIFGGQGDDILFGDDGNDELHGDAGNDQIFGGMGDDVVFGGQGDDVIDGGAGKDDLRGDEGDDYLSGGNDDDHLSGGSGHDHIYGGLGNDTIFITTTDGGDKLYGGAGTDTVDLSATEADSTVDLEHHWFKIGDGDDSEIHDVENIVGSKGRDTLVADESVNVMTGGQGKDTFVFSSVSAMSNNGQAKDTITDFEAGDRIDLSRLMQEVDGHALMKMFFSGYGEANFSDVGAISYIHSLAVDMHEVTIISGSIWSDSNDDGYETYSINLDGNKTLTSDDFVLDMHEFGSAS